MQKNIKKIHQIIYTVCFIVQGLVFSTQQILSFDIRMMFAYFVGSVVVSLVICLLLFKDRHKIKYLPNLLVPVQTTIILVMTVFSHDNIVGSLVLISMVYMLMAVLFYMTSAELTKVE